MNAFKAIATRMVNAEESFLSFVINQGFSREEALKIMAVYRNLKLVKMDAVNGSFHVKHGAYLDVEPMRNALSF